MISLPITVPRVVSVVADGFGVSYTVTFDQAVLWDGFSPGTLNFTDGAATWFNQTSPASLQVIPASGNSAPGTDWNWTSPDVSLTPVPDPSQTGTST